jgi:hypothetical protein
MNFIPSPNIAFSAWLRAGGFGPTERISLPPFSLISSIVDGALITSGKLIAVGLADVFPTASSLILLVLDLLVF